MTDLHRIQAFLTLMKGQTFILAPVDSAAAVQARDTARAQYVREFQQFENLYGSSGRAVANREAAVNNGEGGSDGQGTNEDD
jgi:hypothetical protein